MGRTVEWVVTQARERLRAAGENNGKFRLGWDDSPADGDISLLDLLNAIIRIKLTNDGLTATTEAVTIAARQQDIDLGPSVLEVMEVWFENGDSKTVLKRVPWEELLSQNAAFGGWGEMQFGRRSNRLGDLPLVWSTTPNFAPTTGQTRIRVWPGPSVQLQGLKIRVKKTPEPITDKTVDLDTIIPATLQDALVDILAAAAMARVRMASAIPEGIVEAGAGAAELSADIGTQRDNAVVRKMEFYNYSG